MRSVRGDIPASPLLAVLARPPLGAGARSIHGAARAPVLALAHLGAVETVASVRALLLALASLEAGQTATLAAHVVAQGAVVAVAAVLAVHAVCAGRTGVGTNLTLKKNAS